jgi:sugar (pentulose or hexulose) kinase
VIDAIVPTTHGCTAALVSADELVLPIVDYETEVPDETAEAFRNVAPTFAETQSPTLPAGLNLGRHLFWLQRDFPATFSSAKYVLTYPQYWAWRLCGVTASEITSIGCHAHLWDPRKHCFSSLVERQGWTHLFPPLQPAYAALGSLRPEIAASTGLPADCRVYNGIHDSNSAYSLYLKGRSTPFSLVSTGTWVVMMNPRLPLDRLSQERDTLAFVDLMGEPVPAARYMGGREFEILTSEAGDNREFSEADLRKVIAQQSMLLPSYAPGGPYMGREGSTLGPEPKTNGEMLARVTLYCALMTATSTRRLEMDGDLMIDGGFVNNELYCRLLATLAGCDQCFVNHETEGTAVGAGMLPSWEAEDIESPLQLGPVEKLDDPALHPYVEQWQRAVESN